MRQKLRSSAAKGLRTNVAAPAGCAERRRYANILVTASLLHAAAFGQQSLSVHEAIQEAIASPAARIAEDQVSADRGQVRQAGLRLNPRLYLQSEDLRPWEKNFSLPNQTEDYGYLGQIIELDGKRSKRVAEANANLRRSEDELTLRMQQIAGAVAGSYWAAVAAVRVAGLLSQDLVALDEMVRYHRERVDAGAMRGVDLIRMEIERDRIRLSLEAAERDAELARIELFRQIGRPVDNKIQLTGDITAATSLAPVTLAVVLTQRADVLIARDQLAAAEANLKLQHAIAVPDPDILVGYKRNSGDDTIFASLQIGLPFRNRNQGEIERAEAQVRIARSAVEQTELAVRADVDAATEGYEREQQIVQTLLPEMRDHAKENLEIMTEAYRIGGVDLLRYIDAERTSIEVEITALRTLAEYQQSVLRLQFAYGGRP